MSDHDETAMSTGSGYSTPIPELDDHTSPAPQQRDERPRRGTFDSQFADRRRLGSDASRNVQSQSAVRIQDYDDVIVDDEGEPSPIIGRRQRRGTVDTTADSRSSSPSPPNSVKAFAMARRPAALSFSEAVRPDGADLQRTMSITSHRSKSRTAKESDAASIKTNRTAAEEDVCFPQENRGGTSLYIDFEYLEDFIREQRREREGGGSRRGSDAREFPDLVRKTSETARHQFPTIDGDIIEMPSASSMDEKDKAKAEHAKQESAGHKQELRNRFQFFSTGWEQTVHAKDLEGLIFPGEDIRTLFTPPDDGEDYVWWLNINCPNDEEVREICKAFGIHPLTIEDIVTNEAREKIELFKSYYFANFRSYTAVFDEDGDREFEPFNMFVIVFREGILSFSHKPNHHADEVLKRITNLKDYVDLSSDWICYAIM